MALAYSLFEKNDSERFTEDVNAILELTSASIKMHATCDYKPVAFIDATDIENIKRTLAQYQDDDARIHQIKYAIIEDLSYFQSELTLNHEERLKAFKSKKAELEKQLRVVDYAKKKLVSQRLARLAWPYDDKTQQYDGLIAKFELQLKKLNSKIEEEIKLRPMANEKDILKYQLHLKESVAELSQNLI